MIFVTNSISSRIRPPTQYIYEWLLPIEDNPIKSNTSTFIFISKPICFPNPNCCSSCVRECSKWPANLREISVFLIFTARLSEAAKLVLKTGQTNLH